MTGFTLFRDLFLVERTLSEMYYNNQPLLFNGLPTYICEDTARPHGVKIPKQTAIWDGDNYFITITESNRFKKRMPLIFNFIDPVKGLIVKSGEKEFAGIRQHIGQTEHDTEGCQLGGHIRNEKGVFRSSDWFNAYMPWLEEEIKKYPFQRIPLTIINQQS